MYSDTRLGYSAESGTLSADSDTRLASLPGTHCASPCRAQMAWPGPGRGVRSDPCCSARASTGPAAASPRYPSLAPLRPGAGSASASWTPCRSRLRAGPARPRQPHLAAGVLSRPGTKDAPPWFAAGRQSGRARCHGAARPGCGGVGRDRRNGGAQDPTGGRGPASGGLSRGRRCSRRRRPASLRVAHRPVVRARLRESAVDTRRSPSRAARRGLRADRSGPAGGGGASWRSGKAVACSLLSLPFPRLGLPPAGDTADAAAAAAAAAAPAYLVAWASASPATAAAA